MSCFSKKKINNIVPGTEGRLSPFAVARIMANQRCPHLDPCVKMLNYVTKEN